MLNSVLKWLNFEYTLSISEHINYLKSENDSLKCQLDAYKNEVEMIKAEQKPIDTSAKDAQLKMFQSALQGMQQVSWWGKKLMLTVLRLSYLPELYILWLIVNPTHHYYDIILPAWTLYFVANSKSYQPLLWHNSPLVTYPALKYRSEEHLGSL